MPIQPLAGPGDFFVAERRAVGRRRAGLGRRAVADDRPAGDHRGPALVAGRLHGGGQRGRIVPVDRLDVPAAGLEAPCLVVGGRQAGRPVDGNFVVVEQDDQPAEPEMAGQRDRLLRNALHEAAVAGNRPGPVIDQVVAEARIHHALGQRHADGVGQPLSERPGRRLDAGRRAVFRMPGGAAVQLPEIA